MIRYSSVAMSHPDKSVIELHTQQCFVGAGSKFVHIHQLRYIDFKHERKSTERSRQPNQRTV